jgi:membrane protease subunit HflK
VVVDLRPEGNQFGMGMNPIKNIRLNRKKIKKYIVTAAIVLAVIAFASTCWYTVDDKQKGVVTTFGKVTNVTDAGIHFKAPFGIQQVYKVDVNVYQKIELGYRTEPACRPGDTSLSVMRAR